MSVASVVICSDSSQTRHVLLNRDVLKACKVHAKRVSSVDIRLRQIKVQFVWRKSIVISIYKSNLVSKGYFINYNSTTL